MNTAKPMTLQIANADSQVMISPAIVEVDSGKTVGMGTPQPVTLKDLAALIAPFAAPPAGD